MTFSLTPAAGCEAQGLHTCPMEGFDARRVCEVLGVPARYDVPLVVSTGYCADETAEPTPRRDAREAFCLDGWDHAYVFSTREGEDS